MKLQNRFNTGLDIAKYTAKIMRADMAAYRPRQLHPVAGLLARLQVSRS
jgi:isocitrate lyase